MKLSFFLSPTASCLVWFASAVAVPIAPSAIAQMEHHHHDSGMPHSPTKTGGEHIHKAIAIPAGQPIPTVKLVVYPDAIRGWNIEVKATNFAFAPERVNTKSLTTEGHAHLYVNGKKLARLYGPWYHLEKLPAGQNKLTVTLNTNGHEDLTVGGKVIQDTATIQVR
jgi:hypothetical protein